MSFEEKFVAFIDILGFKSLVEASEAGNGLPLDELLAIPRKLGSDKDCEDIRFYGPTICPNAPRINADVAFCLTQVSDCIIVSTEISPSGVIAIVNHCWVAVIRLLRVGLMCRGYVTRGKIYHTAMQFLGSAYQHAYKQESEVAAFKREADERGTPFIEIAPSVCQFVDECEDSCVREMFSRLVKYDGEIAAVFPFKRLSHSPNLGGLGFIFDANRERKSNSAMRRNILDMKTRVLKLVDHGNPDAKRKADRYCEALDGQLEVCDQIDTDITMLESPFPVSRMGQNPGDKA